MDNDNVTSTNTNTIICKLEHEKIDAETYHQEILETKPIYGFNYSENVEEQQKTIYPVTAKKKDIMTIHSTNENREKYCEVEVALIQRSRTKYGTNKDAIKERSRKRYEANKDTIRERSRATYAANRDKAKARYQANKNIFKERSRRIYEANKDAIKERSRARYAANRRKTKDIYEINKDTKDLSTEYKVKSTLNYDKDKKVSLQENKLETYAIYKLENIEDLKKPRYADKKKARHKINKEIIEEKNSNQANKELIKELSKTRCAVKKDFRKDLSELKYEIRNEVENERVDQETKKEKLETNAIYELKNVDKTKEKQKPRYADKKKARYEANKDIIKERSRARYWANNDILKERARIKYATNKDIRERNRRYYLANKDHINEQKRARRAARSGDTKARYEEKKKVLEENCKLVRNLQNNVKSKRKIKMWTPAEETTLINFLKENVDFMKPTAREFYNRFLENSGMNADWKMVRSKTFTMRRIYNNTKKWLNKIDNAMTDDDKIRNAVHSKCRFYYDFEEIFGSSVQSETLSDQTSNEPSITIVKTENEVFDIYYDKTPSSSHDKSFSVFETSSSHQKSETIKNISDNISTTYCKDNCLHLLASDVIQSRTEILRLGMEMKYYDSILRERKIKFIEKQLAIQEKGLELKEKELKNQEHFIMFELEMKEKSLMTKLELKYKNLN